MDFIKIMDYKNIPVYFNHIMGIFYCNVATKSKVFEDNTHSSKRWEGIKKLIDNAPPVEVKDIKVVIIPSNVNTPIITDIIAINGDSLFLNDNSSILNRGQVYKESILEDEHYQEYLKSNKALKKADEFLQKAYDNRIKICREANLLLLKLNKHRF